MAWKIKVYNRLDTHDVNFKKHIHGVYQDGGVAQRTFDYEVDAQSQIDPTLRKVIRDTLGFNTLYDLEHELFQEVLSLSTIEEIKE